jgi:phosphoglycolate phosphatase
LKRIIFYDLDGTLVDTKDDITASANHMLQEIGLPPMTREEVVPFVGRGLRQLVASLVGCPENAPQADEAMKIYRRHYTLHMLDNSRLYPGAKELLEHFKGRQQAVITNKPNPYSRQILAGLGVDSYFIEVVGGEAESAYPKKPDPSSLIALMRKAGASPKEALFVGDSVVDIQAGKAAGVEMAVVTHGFEEEAAIRREAPEVVVSGFPELIAVARQRGW